VNRHMHQLLFTAGTDSVALPHDEEGPCVSHRGILFAFFFCLFYRFTLSFLVIWGILFSNSFFNSFVSGCAIFVTNADPALRSEAQGGLPRAQATHQGSRASGGP
jgi:hypothetical protein